MNAARQILAAGGASALTMEAVAARAGVGKPTIYRHWANAQELAMAAMMTAEAPTSDDAVDDPLAGLRALADETAARLAAPSGRAASQLLAAAEPDGELFKAFRNHAVLESRARARALIEAAQAAGALRPELGADFNVDLAVDMIFGAIFLRVLLSHAPLTPGLGSGAVDLLLA